MKYPRVIDVLDRMREDCPPYWRLEYEYPDFISVFHGSFVSDSQLIFIGDVNGCIGWNDFMADQFAGDAEGVYEIKEIIRLFWAQVHEKYPDLVKIGA